MLAHPLFLLRTHSQTYQVDQFTLSDWAISSEYAIEMSLQSPSPLPLLNEPACLQVDQHYFHGIIICIQEHYSDQIDEVKLRMVSPLFFFLERYTKQVYYEPTLKAFLEKFLSGAGLRPSLDFKLQFKDNLQPIWFPHYQEAGLTAFYQLLATHGLCYHYEQTDEKATCVVSDSLNSIRPKNKIRLPISQSREMPMAQEVSSAFDSISRSHNDSNAVFRLKTSLQTSTMIAGHLNPQNNKLLVKETNGSKDSSLGKLKQLGHCDPKVAEYQQMKMDEQKRALTLHSTDWLTPGQSIAIPSSTLPIHEYYIQKLTLIGNKKLLQGAKNTTDVLAKKASVIVSTPPQPNSLPRGGERTRTGESMTTTEKSGHSLQVNASAVAHYHGLPPLVEWTPNSRWHLAIIEHETKDDLEMSEKGEYRLRLHMDKSSEAQGAKSRGNASPWIRSALYFAGNHYGFSLPYHNESEVITAFENGHIERPIIMGALSSRANRSVVTQMNNSEGVLRSHMGHALQFKSEEQGACLALQTPLGMNQFHIAQNKIDGVFKLQSVKGGMAFDTQKELSLQSNGVHNQESQKNQQFWGEQQGNIVSHQLTINGKDIARFHSHSDMRFVGDEQKWVAKDQIQCNSSMSFILKSKKNVLLSSKGKQQWNTHQGNIHIKSKKNMTFQGGKAIMQQALSTWNLSTPGVILLNAPAIGGL